jgi:hypothetical protein
MPFFLVKQHILYKTTSFHSLFIEKKKQNDVVLTALYTIFFHWSRKGRGCTPSSSIGRAKAGEEGFSSPILQRLSLSLSLCLCLSLSLSPLYLSKNSDTTHTPSWPTTMMKGAEETNPVGGSGAAAQRPPQPLYPFAMTGQG